MRAAILSALMCVSAVAADGQIDGLVPTTNYESYGGRRVVVTTGALETAWICGYEYIVYEAKILPRKPVQINELVHTTIYIPANQPEYGPGDRFWVVEHDDNYCDASTDRLSLVPQ